VQAEQPRRACHGRLIVSFGEQDVKLMRGCRGAVAA
jgi:hypothetical protein